MEKKEASKKGAEPKALALLRGYDKGREVKNFNHALVLIEAYVQKALRKNEKLRPVFVKHEASRFVLLLYTILEQKGMSFLLVKDIDSAKKIVRQELGLTEMKSWLGDRKDARIILDQSGVRSSVLDLYQFIPLITKDQSPQSYLLEYKRDVKNTFTWLKVVAGLKSQQRVRLKMIFMNHRGRWNSSRFFFSLLFSATLGRVCDELSAKDVLVCFEKMRNYEAWLDGLAENVKNVYGDDPLIQSCFDHSDVIELIDFFKKESNRTILALKGDIRLKGQDTMNVEDFRSYFSSAVNIAIGNRVTPILDQNELNKELGKEISRLCERRNIKVVAETVKNYPWVAEWLNSVQVKRILIADFNNEYCLGKHLSNFAGKKYFDAKKELAKQMTLQQFLNTLFSSPAKFGIGSDPLENNKYSSSIDTTLFDKDTLSVSILKTICFKMSLYEFVNWVSETEKNFKIPGNSITKAYATFATMVMGDALPNSIKEVISKKAWLHYITQETRLNFKESVDSLIKDQLKIAKTTVSLSNED